VESPSLVGRRRFVILLGGAAAALPLSAKAQSASKVYRIGLLSSASSSAGADRLQALKQGLRDLGYAEGQNLTIEYRFAEGREDRLSALAADLVRLKVDVIVTQGSLATLIARRTAPTIPIIFAVAGDPVQGKLVTNLARPDGNVTGFAVMGAETTAKRLELLREAVPGMTRIAALWNRSNPSSEPEWKQTESAATALGLEAQSVEVIDPERLGAAFAMMPNTGVGGAIVLSDSMLFGQRMRIANLSAQNRLPAIAWTREFSESGLLMVYGPDVADMHRRAATYVHKVLGGAKPADLPVQQPTKFELVINLKTAKALGLIVPPALLARADEVIE
jgi:putative ABC transport system substrate-binding protein